MLESLTTDDSVHIPDYIYDAAYMSDWAGTILPKIKLDGVWVYPVVSINQEALKWRQIYYQNPELDISTLDLWESWLPELGTLPPPSPISIVGCICDTSPARKGLNNLWRSRGLGAGMLIYRNERKPQKMTLFECDIDDNWLVWVRGGKIPQICVKGRMGPAENTYRTPLVRKREEILYGHVIKLTA